MINLATCFIEFVITLTLDFVNVPIPLKLNTKSHQPVAISLARVFSTKEVIHLADGIFYLSIDHYAVDNYGLVLEVMPCCNDWKTLSAKTFALPGACPLSGAAYSAHCNLI